LAYRRTARRTYGQFRRKGLAPKALKLSAAAPASKNVFKTREFQSNITDIALFLAKFLSGKNEVSINPIHSGFACRIVGKGGKKYYEILVPKWSEYNLPLDPKSKYRIYREGLWHEACHIRYTPEEIYSIGADKGRLVDPLRHDVANIIEDRRIEDLGTKMWPGYKAERLFSNAYFWSQRMDVGEFWKTYLEPYYDPQKGEFRKPSGGWEEEWLKRRISHMRHEAFLQRLITGKIKGAENLPLKERQLIEDVAAYVEDELKKITKENVSGSRVYNTVKSLTDKVIKDLQLQHYSPPIWAVGQSSWDVTFTPEWAENQGTDDREKVRAGIDDYFDEIVKVEYICTVCGKPYTKIYGHRHKPGKSTPPPGYKPEDFRKKRKKLKAEDKS